MSLAESLLVTIINVMTYQVYLVMGGKIGESYLATTEQLTVGDTKWTQTEELPRPLMGLKAATLGNTVYLTGEIVRLF